MTGHRGVVRVRDVMKTQLDVVDGLTTVADALRTMQHTETKTLLVAKRHDDEYGIVLLSDIAEEVLTVDRAPERPHGPRQGPLTISDHTSSGGHPHVPQLLRPSC